MDLPDFTLLTTFTENRIDVLTPITKELVFLVPNNGIIAIGTVLNNPKWRVVGYITPSYDFLLDGNRLVGQSKTLFQTNTYEQFYVFKFDYPLIGLKLRCKPWITFISCEIYLGNIS